MGRFLSSAFLAMLSGLLIALVFIVVTRALDAPQVHISFSTKQCIRVDDPAAERERREAFTCEALPERFEVIWVR